MSSNQKFILLQIFTGLRLIISFVFAFALLAFQLTDGIVIFIIILALCAELTDTLDGVLARKYSLTSTFGAYFDPLVDSLSRLTIYFALAVKGITIIWLPIIMSFRDIIVAYLRIYAMHAQIVVSARASGKIKAWAQGLGVFLLLATVLFLPPGETSEISQTGISVIVIAITLWSLVDYFIGVIKLVDSKKQD